VSGLQVLPVNGLPEITEGDDLGELIAGAAELEDGDIVVVAQKVVSKAEGRVLELDAIDVSSAAREIAAADGRDARQVQAVLDEAARIVRRRGGFVIAETRHGFVCASAGVDASNAPAPGQIVLLPLDPDASAAALRARLREVTGRELGVLVSDSFGRAWRQGTTDVAIGAAGVPVLLDLTGVRDSTGYELHATMIAVADEIAGAAELVMGKTNGIPAAIVRGLGLEGDGNARELVMPSDRDLFR
jgi:coenzyme F420-0:L-glutamate ligase / coenzyme F420-1:gamma-L-glutamate ligase